MPAFFPTRGGIEVLVENLTQKLNAEGLQRHAVLAPRISGERPDNFWLGNTRVYSIDAPDPLQFAATPHELVALITERKLLAAILLNVQRVLETTKPRLLHLHGFSMVGHTASAVGRTRGIPHILHVHGKLEDAVSPRIRNQIDTARQVICVSEAVKESVELDSGRISDLRVIRNGQDDALVALGSHARTFKRTSIAMVGRLEPSKGFDIALRTFAGLLKQGYEFEVQLVGVGRDHEVLQRLVFDLGISTSVHFHGRCDHRETLGILAGSTCVVVPSSAYEGFSLVALESAFLERPVIASNIGGLPETVVHGVTGLIFDPHVPGALERNLLCYLENESLAREHGSNARQRALKEFSLNRMAHEIELVHAQALTG